MTTFFPTAVANFPPVALAFVVDVFFDVSAFTLAPFFTIVVPVLAVLALLTVRAAAPLLLLLLFESLGSSGGGGFLPRVEGLVAAPAGAAVGLGLGLDLDLVFVVARVAFDDDSAGWSCAWCIMLDSRDVAAAVLSIVAAVIAVVEDVDSTHVILLGDDGRGFKGEIGLRWSWWGFCGDSKSLRCEGDGGSVRELPDLGERTVEVGGLFVRCFLAGRDVVLVASAVFSLSEARASLVRLMPREGRGAVTVADVFDLVGRGLAWSISCCDAAATAASSWALAVFSSCRCFSISSPMFTFRRLVGILFTRISIRVRRLCACSAYCALNFLARSVTSSWRLSIRACFCEAVMPMGAARLEGEDMGVLVGDFVIVRVAERVVLATVGDTLVFLVRAGAIFLVIRYLQVDKGVKRGCTAVEN